MFSMLDVINKKSKKGVLLICFFFILFQKIY